MNSSSLLAVQHLSLIHSETQRTLVDDLSFAVSAGECVALVGESGSGKSLTALSLVDLLPSGIHIGEKSQIFWREQTDFCRLKKSAWHAYRGRDIGMIFQDPLHALNPVMTVGEQLIEVLQKHYPSLSYQEIKHEAVRRFDEVELPHALHLLNAYPCHLSGGQQQRVMIALAISARPSLLIADEPTTALDTLTRYHLLDLLERLRKERQSGLLLISHDLRLIERRADRVLVLEKGYLRESGITQQLFQMPQHTYTKKLLNARPYVNEVLEQRRLSVPQLLASDVLLSMQAVTKKLDNFLLKSFDLDLKLGQSIAIMGGSGSGKSTVARLMMGLIQPTTGEILYRGVSVGQLSVAQRHSRRCDIQMIFQNPYASLNPSWTVEAILREPLELMCLSVSKQADRERIQSVLAAVELDGSVDMLRRRPSDFSGGQRQRLALARALLLEPKFLVCDEATSALDVSIQADIVSLLQRLRREQGLGLLVIAHDLAMIAALADEVIVMHSGEVIERGCVENVLLHPEHLITSALCEAA